MLSKRTPPIIIPASSSPEDPSRSAAFIFVHGFGDDAVGVESIPRQFQAANKLPYLTWVLPNATENRDAMSTAWYTPSRLSPYPPSRPELEEDEDEPGMMLSTEYLTTVIDKIVEEGIPRNRIILGGFSQGCAMSLLVGLTSTYAGKLGGLVGLSGYLPLVDRIPTLREERGLPPQVADDTHIFLARGTSDMLVPKRHFRICYEKLFELGVKQENVTLKEYEGMGHGMAGEELRDLCEWLERVVPDMN